jgi:hypothetical protein
LAATTISLAPSHFHSLFNGSPCKHNSSSNTI